MAEEIYFRRAQRDFFLVEHCHREPTQRKEIWRPCGGKNCCGSWGRGKLQLLAERGQLRSVASPLRLSANVAAGRGGFVHEFRACRDKIRGRYTAWRGCGAGGSWLPGNRKRALSRVFLEARKKEREKEYESGGNGRENPPEGTGKKDPWSVLMGILRDKVTQSSPRVIPSRSVYHLETGGRAYRQCS
ncbi:hypothetical protein K0M31_017328 [Melipona bicolor]|uniref:Uncharacterized protein n=1 Tax=Melipona bicolor TaxID=60889 RepID=A0AA40KSC0_9HYME|nr:hypothetical protein K0M31_017328 [Melipona bicolor]